MDINYTMKVNLLKYNNMDNIKLMSIDDNKLKAFEKVYEYALEMTKKEIHQAVEGLYHNLNTLQSMAA